MTAKVKVVKKGGGFRVTVNGKVLAPVRGQSSGVRRLYMGRDIVVKVEGQHGRQTENEVRRLKKLARRSRRSTVIFPKLVAYGKCKDYKWVAVTRIHGLIVAGSTESPSDALPKPLWALINRLRLTDMHEGNWGWVPAVFDFGY